MENAIKTAALTIAHVMGRLIGEWRGGTARNPYRYKKARLHDLLETFHFIPQAVIESDVESLPMQADVWLEQGVDDFDEYTGTGFILDDVPVALMRYAGHPSNQYTMYLPRTVSDIDEITNIVSKIAVFLKLSDKEIVWQRKDNPDF